MTNVRLPEDWPNGVTTTNALTLIVYNRGVPKGQICSINIYAIEPSGINQIQFSDPLGFANIQITRRTTVDDNDSEPGMFILCKMFVKPKTTSGNTTISNTASVIVDTKACGTGITNKILVYC